MMELDRKTFIGGSDAAAIFGVSPWATPLDIYLRKRGEMPETGRDADPMRERVLKRGKRLEPIVLAMATEEWGLIVTKASTAEAQNRYIDPEYNFLACEIDFEWQVSEAMALELGLPAELIGTVQNGEIKTVHPFAAAKFGEAESEEVPIEYAAQAMHGMMITGKRLCLFAVLVGADNLSRYIVYRDEETIAAMREKEITFWHNHVQPGNPPKPLNLPDVYHLFSRAAGKEYQATPDVVVLVDRLKTLKETSRRAAEGIEDTQFQIGHAMLADGIVRDEKGNIRPGENVKPGSHTLLAGAIELLTIRLQSQTRIDAAAVREKHPQVAEECSKTSSFFSFNLSRKKK